MLVKMFENSVYAESSPLTQRHSIELLLLHTSLGVHKVGDRAKTKPLIFS